MDENENQEETTPADSPPVETSAGVDVVPTAEQLENAKAAGWDPDDGTPPDGWDAHGKDPGPVAQLADPQDTDSGEANDS